MARQAYSTNYCFLLQSCITSFSFFFFFLMIRRPPNSTLFPSTPLFRSTVTAGNAWGINAGAAAVVVMWEQKAKGLRLTPLARIRAYAAAGVDPSIMGMGPWPASEKALQKAGLRREEIDLWELNEAFAAQSLGVLRELRIPKNRVNVNGGAIPLGPPTGASGGPRPRALA